MTRKIILCFGAGGHAKVVIDSIRVWALPVQFDVAGIIAASGEGGDVLGVPILGDDENLKRVVAETGATHFVIGIGTVRGGGMLRPKLFAEAIRAGLQPFTVIHRTAVVSPHAKIDPGATIMAGVIVQPGVHIGSNAILNTRSSVDHDCRIGAHVHIAPGGLCSGGVSIGERSHLGSGAVVIQGVRIGEDVTVGAGATVVKDCDAGSVVVGTPARPWHR